MGILNKKFILGCVAYIALYVFTASLVVTESLPEFIKIFQHRLGHDFFLVMAPLVIINVVMGLGAFLVTLHQIFFAVKEVFIENLLRHFKRK